MRTVETLIRLGGYVFAERNVKCVLFVTQRLICFSGHRFKLKSKQRINAHTGDEEAVFIDLLCFMEAYEAQIRLKVSASLASSLNKLYEACLFFENFYFLKMAIFI